MAVGTRDKAQLKIPQESCALHSLDPTTFAQRVNKIFGDKEDLKFNEEECEQVNTLLWGYVVSLI